MTKCWDGSKSHNRRFYTVVPISLWTEQALLSVDFFFRIQATDQTLAIYTTEMWMAGAGIKLLAHCVLHSAQGNHVENGLNGA